MATPSYEQTIFDKAVVKALQLIKKHSESFKYLDFAEAADISASSLSEALSGNRGFPKHKIEGIKYQLVSKHGVRSEFLATGKGSVFVKPLDLDEGEFPEVTEMKKKLSEQASEIAKLTMENNYLKQINKTQEELILSLKKR